MDDPEAIPSPGKTRTLAYKNSTFENIILHNGWTENMHVRATEIEDGMVIFNLFKSERCSEISPGRKAETSASSSVGDGPRGGNPPPFASLKPHFMDVVSKAQTQQ